MLTNGIRLEDVWYDRTHASVEGVYVSEIPLTGLPCWSTMFAVMVNVSSAVIVDERGETSSVSGAPAVTVIVWVPQTRPKQA